MRQVSNLYRSSVGKKALMAISGVLLAGFVVAHMLGNLKMFQGPEAMDSYAVFLKQAGYPILPEYGLLWIARLALLGAIGVHVAAAFQLWRQSRAARPRGYRKEDSQVLSYASRTLRWGGVIILLFVIFHIQHFTTGRAHPDFVYGAVYQNVVLGFQSVPVAFFYLSGRGFAGAAPLPWDLERIFHPRKPEPALGSPPPPPFGRSWPLPFSWDTPRFPWRCSPDS
jgi:succinate dehydrogenase / fumarate reductase, cytochrome b subunit